MARKAPRPDPTAFQSLKPLINCCPECNRHLRCDYLNYRTVVRLSGLLHLALTICRCHNRACGRYRKPYRPEAEGRLVLPEHEFGLDVIAKVGSLRYRQHLSVPEIHQQLGSQGLDICERTVTNLLDRYDELLAFRLSDSQRLRKVLQDQKRLVLAIDGMQPDVGHEVLCMLRDCLSGQVLLARSLLSSTEKDLSELIEQVRREAGAPIVGVISDGQHSIRNAVAATLAGVPH